MMLDSIYGWDRKTKIVFLLGCLATGTTVGRTLCVANNDQMIRTTILDRDIAYSRPYGLSEKLNSKQPIIEQDPNCCRIVRARGWKRDWYIRLLQYYDVFLLTKKGEVAAVGVFDRCGNHLDSFVPRG